MKGGTFFFRLITVKQQKSQNLNSYKPTVTMRTFLNPPLESFFTTKPTGSGTGLGLSLSYDIIKAHGGEIKVETKEGEGSGFIIQLSINDHKVV